METKSSEKHQPIFEAIQELLEVIRGRQPGIDSLKAKKLKRKFARELSLYFRQLGRNLPYRDLPGYLDRNVVIKEQADDEAIRMAANATQAMNQRLNGTMRRNIESGFQLGVNQAHQVFRLEPTFDLLDDGAVRWMNNRAAEMVTKIDDETRRRLAETLSRGARAGDSTATLAKRIRTEVNAMADISKGRAHLIATTELNNSMSEASLQTYDRLGVSSKSWSTVGDDDVSDECMDNEAAGIIPLDGTFPGGVGRPPQHPDCRCTLVPERMPASLAAPADLPQQPGLPSVSTKSEMDRITTNKWTAEKFHSTTNTPSVQYMKDTIAKEVPLKDLKLVKSVNVVDGELFLGKINASGVYNLDGTITMAAKQTTNVVTHEFGHAVMTSWHEGATAQKVRKIFEVSKKKNVGFVSEYAKTNAGEFFAESYRVFHSAPEVLLAKNKPIYTLLKSRYK